MADEVLTQADIDKAVEAAIAKQKADDAAEANVTVGHYQIDKKWLKWIISAVLLLAYANGWLDKDTVTQLITTVPMSKAPEVKEPVEPEPPRLAESAPTAISPDDVQKWIDIFKPLVIQIIDSIPKPPIPVDPPKPDPKPVVVNPPVVVTPPVVNPPTPSPGSLRLTLTDAAGLPAVSSSVPSGKLLVVKLEGFKGKVDWVKRPTGDVQFADMGNQSASIVLTGPAELDLIVTDYGSQSQVSLRILSNQGAQPPPPVVTVDPVTPPAPVNPPLVPRKFIVSVVEDPDLDRTVTTASILNNLTIRDKLKAKGHTFKPQILNDGSPVAEYVKTMRTPLPALVIQDDTGHVVKSEQLPVDLGLSLLAGMGG